jgi:hypothetical protein
MATLKYHVTYEDGKKATYKVKPRHLIALEDAMDGSALSEENATSKNAYKLPFLAACDDDFNEANYKAWLKTVDEIENEGGEEPTEGAPPVDGEATEPVPTE